jgi:diaminopimelate decarboxylase
VAGIDCHIGSQITEVAPYVEALDRVLDLVDAIESDGIRIHHIDLGGGLASTTRATRPRRRHAVGRPAGAPGRAAMAAGR